jgi:pilus assembly protein CpaE
MLTLVVLTSNPVAADGIEQLAQESSVFKLVFKGSPIPQIPAAIRTLRAHNPDLILLDIGNWEAVSALAGQIKQASLGGTVIGFEPSWNRLEQVTFEDAGIVDLLREPFSLTDLETAAYDALHRDHPVTNQNILAFLPAKAGSGCSTVALNTAAALVSHLGKKVLLIEADRRSGVLSILLNLQHREGLTEALEHAGEITPVEWHQYYAEAFGVHLLLANPTRRGPLPTWADYYQLLRYVQKQYDFLIIDLPEIVNEATAEVVKSARGVFVVCTPEVPSLKMASQRYAELKECEIPADHVHIVLNRWERGKLSIQDIEGILERPVFATLPNDYAHVKDAILESRLVARESAFAESCLALARKLSGLPEAPQEQSKFALLKRLGRITS